MALRRVTTGLVLVAILIAPRGPVQAWVFPEHRQISLQAVQGLDTEHRALLDRLWAEARMGHTQRLCAPVIVPDQGAKPPCLDWATWAAVAGDHTCSGREMLGTLLDSGWIMNVAHVGAELGRHLAGGGSASSRENVLRDSDIKLLRVDPQYATRAESNNAHFLLPRPSPGTGAAAYLQLSVREGAEPNALAAYASYHLSALRRVAQLAATPATFAWGAAGFARREPWREGSGTPPRVPETVAWGAAGLARREPWREGSGTPPRVPETIDAEAVAILTRAVLADEAFALHFLQDTFAAGHVAGSWGATAVRKGTHDYYNERGLEVVTWNNNAWVLEGDAHLRPEDAERAAKVVRTSLAQVLDVASGKIHMPPDIGDTLGPESLDLCRTRALPGVNAPAAVVPLWHEIVDEIPAPALIEGPGALPRFRTELGRFIGVSAAAQSAWVSGGFAASQGTGGAIGALSMGVRFGLGLEGVMGQAGDGLVFLDVGLRQDTASSMQFVNDPALVQTGALTAAIPARSGLAIRARLPFWLVPGDLLLGAIFVAPFSRTAFRDMAVGAGNGGFLPWQAGLSTSVGRFQLILGREVGVVLYGFLGGKNRLLMPPAVPGESKVRLVALRSMSFDFPILEYRPFRSFSMDQASILVLQLFAGLDMPMSAAVLDPVGAPLPELRTIFNAGLRLAFDWRPY